MSGAVVLGIYRPGTTVFHRLPVGAKLLVLATFSGLVVGFRGPVSAGITLAAAILAAALARLDLRTALRALRSILMVALFFGAFVAWQTTWVRAIEVVADLVALVIASTVFTATTRINAMLDAIVRWLRPLRRLGVDPERVGLAFALMIRAVPGTVEIALETRDAARARGLGRSPRALLVPMVVRVVAQAHDTGAALHARGIGDD